MLTMIMRTLVLVLLFVPHLTQAARVQKFDHVDSAMFASGDPPILFPPRVSPMHILGEELTLAARTHGEESLPAARPHGDEPILFPPPPLLIFPPSVSPMHILGEELTPPTHPHGVEPSPAAHRSH